jgi:hypothetical protein
LEEEEEEEEQGMRVERVAAALTLSVGGKV